MAEMSSIILISGPPGAGKSAVARLLAAALDAPVAYIEGDTFWHFITKRRVGSSKLEARAHDSRIVIRAMIAAAARYAHGGYQTVLDFTIGPWLLKLIQSALKETPLDYVVLCPSENICAQRAAERPEGAMPDYSEYAELHAAFCVLGEFEKHAIRSDTAGAAELAAQIRAGLGAGAYRVKALR
jgi:cytidylate kinase